MGLVVVTPPTELVVSVAEAKEWANVSVSDDDARIRGLILAATELAQTIQRRQLLTATLRLTLPSFSDEIFLLRPPIQSVSSIAYVDELGSTQTLAADQYTLDTSIQPGLIIPAYDASYPSTRYDRAAVSITYLAGYTSPELVPEATKTAILMMVARAYDHRGDSPKDEVEMSSQIQSLLAVDSWGFYPCAEY